MESKTKTKTKGIDQEELIRWAREQIDHERSVAEGRLTEAMKEHHYGRLSAFREMAEHFTGYTIRCDPRD